MVTIVTNHTHPYLIPPEVVSIVLQQFRDLLHIYSIIEWSSISDLPFIGRHLDDGEGEGRGVTGKERGKERGRGGE